LTFLPKNSLQNLEAEKPQTPTSIVQKRLHHSPSYANSTPSKQGLHFRFFIKILGARSRLQIETELTWKSIFATKNNILCEFLYLRAIMELSVIWWKPF